ncbi:MAG: FkbM family methyltransferase [Ignavibacteriaceae bacterium]
MYKQIVADYLKKVGLYKPIRKIYNSIGRYNKQTEILIDKNKIKFWTPTYYLDDYVKNLAGEEQFLNEILLRLNEHNVFWDVGANIGFYSIVAAKIKDTNGKIFAFEPEPKTFSLLRKNIELNKMNNITSLSIALGDTDGDKLLYPSDTPNFGAHSFVQRTDYRVKKKGIKININTADKLIDEMKIDVPDIMKIDVEGAEILILRGMKRLLMNKKLKTIFCEIHVNLLPLFGSSEEEVLEIFRKENFHIDYSQNRSNQNQYIFVR